MVDARQADARQLLEAVGRLGARLERRGARGARVQRLLQRLVDMLTVAAREPLHRTRVDPQEDVLERRVRRAVLEDAKLAELLAAAGRHAAARRAAEHAG
eukprot:5054093-Prymnesium_polylepis.1